MKINLSKATFSSIVGIGQKVARAEKETGQKYLPLNRGVNAVCQIDLSKIIPMIDFQSKDLQVYAPNLGVESLRQSILKEYFPSQTDLSKLAITPGGMPALDLIIQTLNVETILFPKFYWGSYSKMATIRNKSFSFYDDLDSIDISKLNDSTCIFICDPNNPTGTKLEDDYLLSKLQEINNSGAVTIFDCPYRRLFKDQLPMRMFDQVSQLENVIIAESFSKWIGLSGLRIGFIWCNNKAFNEELNIRLLYEFNGISTASQLIVDKILSTEEGKQAQRDFRRTTVEHIQKNIQYLKDNNLLVEEIYQGRTPWGIFAIINKSEDYLFNHQIGAVGLDKFVYHDKDKWSDYSRVCVSVDSQLFKEYFDKINSKK
jgi:aspartate/methionine/tyrosine aminotransferase